MNRLVNYVRLHERILSTVTLALGFIFDAYFFRRIDLPFENIAIILHFVVGFIAIILLHLATARYQTYRVAGWIIASAPLVLQFAIGGLFGKFFIFFFRSGSIIVSWPVLVLLLVLTFANESARNRYARLNFSLGVFYTALLIYCIIAAPVFLKSISSSSFIIGGIVSLGIIALVIKLINYLSHDIDKREQRRLFIIIGCVFGAFNSMYFLNILPPIPLALKDAGVYHGVVRTAPGVYEGKVEPHSWVPFLPEVFHKNGADPVYVFTAVFAPANLATTVVHVWQWKNAEGKWIIEQSIPLNIVGGRDGGYRGYSFRASAQAGDWRVDVQTPRGQLLGRIDFKVEEVHTSVQLKMVNL